LRPPPRCSLFPYTTLFRSSQLVLTRQRPVLRKQFVGDAHLHVVGLTGEDHQRLVLRLPAKTADGAIVSVVVEGAANPQRKRWHQDRKSTRLNSSHVAISYA